MGEYDIDDDEDCDECGDCAPPSQDIPIAKFRMPGKCTSRSSCVVVELERKVKFNEFVQPICIEDNTVSSRTLPNEQVMLRLGWGVQYAKDRKLDESSQKRLMYEVVEVAERALCSDSEDSDDEEEERKMCLARKGTAKSRRSEEDQEEEGDCIGDTGGPIVAMRNENGILRAYLVAINRDRPAGCQIGKSDTIPDDNNLYEEIMGK